MINPGDKFSVTLVLAADNEVKMDYRIAGLGKIKDVTVMPLGDTGSIIPWPIRWMLGATMLGFSAAIAIWAFEFGKTIAKGV
jgi:hypothetical protein